MKLMFASDIHGSRSACERVLERYDAEGADRLILLGDLLYHGPRNDLPDGYDPKRVAALLAGRSEKILCVRGNCEAEVDQMMLPFPVMAEYAWFTEGGRLFFLTHGHRFGPTNRPPLSPGDVLVCGHTHIPAFEENKDGYYLNPGSVSIPKDGSVRGAVLLSGDRIAFTDLSGRIWRECTLPPTK